MLVYHSTTVSWTEIVISCTILHSEDFSEICLLISIDEVRGTVVVVCLNSCHWYFTFLPPKLVYVFFYFIVKWYNYSNWVCDKILCLVYRLQINPLYSPHIFLFHIFCMCFIQPLMNLLHWNGKSIRKRRKNTI